MGLGPRYLGGLSSLQTNSPSTNPVAKVRLILDSANYFAKKVYAPLGQIKMEEHTVVAPSHELNRVYPPAGDASGSQSILRR